MPCLIVTGYPSAGKTTLSKLLKERALIHSEIDNVILLNEESACPDHTKNECYINPSNEKQTRAALKSAFDRAVGAGGGSSVPQQQQQSKNNNKNKKKQTLVILDSLNYIKGFRYELHCISKASGERHGVLWVLNRLNLVEEWNSKRPEKDAYQKDVLKELIQRYEPPDERNRWDKPLYTIDVAPPGTSSLGDSKSEAVRQSVYNMHALGEALGKEGSNSTTFNSAGKKKPKKSAFSRARATPAAAVETVPTIEASTPVPNATASSPTTSNSTVETGTTKEEEKKEKSLEEQLDEILDSFLLKVQPLKEGNSTRQHIAENANVLQELDSTTQRLISTIVNAQNFHTGGKLQVKTAGGISLSMTCKRRVALPELRRLRKQYLQWVASHPPDDTTEKGIATSFLKYLEEQL